MQDATVRRMKSSKESEESPGVDDLRVDGNERLSFVSSTGFQSFVMGVIFLNTFTMAVQANYPDHFSWHLINRGFLLFFIIELVLRLTVYRCSFFTNSDKYWNIFDLLVVTCGVFSTVLKDLRMMSTEGEQRGQIGTMMRIARVGRMARLLRTLRLMRTSRARFVVDGLLASAGSVGWMALLFFLLIFVYAIFITNVLKSDELLSNITGFDDNGTPGREVVEHKFGTMLSSMDTLYCWLSFDDWSTVARMVTNVCWWMEFVWISYMMLGAYTLFSLITGLMVDQLNDVKGDAEVSSKMLQVHELSKHLIEQFGPDHDERLTWQEFKGKLVSDETKTKMDKCEIAFEKSELKSLFSLLDRDKSGKVSCSEFTDGLNRIILGHQTLLDLMLLEGGIRKLERTLRCGSCPEFIAIRIERVAHRVSKVMLRLDAVEHDLGKFFEELEHKREYVADPSDEADGEDWTEHQQHQ